MTTWTAFQSKRGDQFVLSVFWISTGVTILNTYICNNNKAPETGEWVCGVGVGVRRGLRGASVPRWSA